MDWHWPAWGFLAHGNLREVSKLHVRSLLHPLIYWETEGQKDESNCMGSVRKIWLGGMDRGMDLGYCLKMKKNRASNALIAPRKPTCTHVITVSCFLWSKEWTFSNRSSNSQTMKLQLQHLHLCTGTQGLQAGRCLRDANWKIWDMFQWRTGTKGFFEDCIHWRNSHIVVSYLQIDFWQQLQAALHN